ncbi:synaptic plasticity regulator PANTS [Lasioglossum baleicum]|uniref:synaptic plasticity regulator PANTS n=1 Tax=Lasioglossum baleicum TaxID=434251 RepID=UPI003FCDEBE8
MPELNGTSEVLSVEEKVKPDEKGKPDEEKQKNDKEDLRNLEWMIRPCEIYNEEHSDCKSIAARFHQYFVFGKSIDCSQWKTDYQNCYRWEKYKSEQAYESLINSEKKRRLERLRAHYANDTWEKRNAPPENWNAPLPEWLQKKLDTSYLANAAKLEQDYNKSSCSIS